MPPLRPASLRYIAKFGRVVLIDDEHPLALAERAAAPVGAPVGAPDTARTDDTRLTASEPASAVASVPDAVPAPLTKRTRGRRA